MSNRPDCDCTGCINRDGTCRKEAETRGASLRLDRTPSPQPTRGEALLGPGEFLADGQVGHDGTGLLPSPSGADDPMDRGCEYVACAWACPKRKITGTCDGCSARPVFASGADDVEALVLDYGRACMEQDGEHLDSTRTALLDAIRDREGAVREALDVWFGNHQYPVFSGEKHRRMDAAMEKLRALSARGEG